MGNAIQLEPGAVELDSSVILAARQVTKRFGALVALDPRTGAIRAMVGGYDYGRSEYNRAVSAHRQSGSAIKPLIYATALNEGLSPATLLVDAPVVYEDEEQDRIGDQARERNEVGAGDLG